MSTPGTAAHFRPEIEGLRGIAILLVLLFHLDLPWAAGGYVGVDAFFVLSGYLITQTLLLEVERRGTVSLVAFYARRIRRLLPAAAVVFALTGVAAWLIGERIAFVDQAVDGAAAVMYSANLRFAAVNSDYLAIDTGPSPFLHAWSLGVEEQFYLIYPLLFVLATRFLSRRARVIAWLAALCLAIAVAAWATEINGTLAFYLLPTRAAPLLAGALVALLSVPSVRGGTGIALVGVAGLLLSTVLMSAETSYPGVAILVPTIATVAVIVGASGQNAAASALSTPALRYLGRVSYSLYLVHWPIAVFIATALPDFSVERVLLVAAASLLVASLSRRFVEEPFLKKSTAHWRNIAIGTATSLTIAALLLAGSAFATRGLDPALLALRPSLPDLRGDIPPIYENDCHAEFGGTTNPECRYGADKTASRATVVLLGDSHAAQWFPALERLALERDWTLFSFTKSGCPFTDSLQAIGGVTPYPECAQWRTDVTARIRALSPTLVVVSASLISEHEVRQPSVGGTTDMLRELGSPLLLLADTPRLPLDPAICLERHGLGVDGRGGPECGVPAPVTSDGAPFELELSKELGGSLRLVSLTPSVCPERRCTPVLGGVITFRDRDHLSQTFARELSKTLAPVIAELLPR